MYRTRLDAKAWLSSLGAERWDTFPPQEGRIRWFNSEGEPVASGRYEVILSWGPGMKYTMGWAVEAYASMGIPFVAEAKAGEPRLVDPATEEQAYARADDLARKLGADFAYQCSTLLVAVHDVHLGAAPPALSAPVPKPKPKPKVAMAKPKAKSRPKPKAKPAKKRK